MSKVVICISELFGGKDLSSLNNCQCKKVEVVTGINSTVNDIC